MTDPLQNAENTPANPQDDGNNKVCSYIYGLLTGAMGPLAGIAPLAFDGPYTTILLDGTMATAAALALSYAAAASTEFNRKKVVTGMATGLVTSLALAFTLYATGLAGGELSHGTDKAAPERPCITASVAGKGNACPSMALATPKQ